MGCGTLHRLPFLFILERGGALLLPFWGTGPESACPLCTSDIIVGCLCSTGYAHACWSREETATPGQASHSQLHHHQAIGMWGGPMLLLNAFLWLCVMQHNCSHGRPIQTSARPSRGPSTGKTLKCDMQATLISDSPSAMEGHTETHMEGDARGRSPGSSSLLAIYSVLALSQILS